MAEDKLHMVLNGELARARAMAEGSHVIRAILPDLERTVEELKQLPPRPDMAQATFAAYETAIINVYRTIQSMLTDAKIQALREAEHQGSIQ